MVHFSQAVFLLFAVVGVADGQVQHAVGIDLGTTMTVISRYYKVGEGTQGETFINDQGERLTPSVVHFESESGGELLVGHAAKNLLVKDSASTVYGIKRLLGKDFDAVAPLVRDLAFDEECTNPNQTTLEAAWQFAWGGSFMRSVESCPDKDFKEQLTRVAHSSYRPSSPPSFGGVCVWQWDSWWPVELISALVLKEVKQSAERAIGAPVRKAVVTIPAYFGEPQKQATRVAAQIAGLDVLRLLAEPTAAAISYARNKKTDFTAAERLLVFDLGGGTFDVSVLNYEGKGEFKVLAVTGDAQLGGEDLDVTVATFLLAEFSREHSDLSAERRAKLFPRFVRAGRQAKEKLSFRTSVDVVIEAVSPGGDDFVLKLSRAKFERLCRDFFAKLMPIVRQGVRDSGLQLADIHRVLLVGGSSRIPKVRELLKLEFKSDPDQILNPDEAVADGAAVLAFQLANPGVLNVKDESLLSLVYDSFASITGTETASRQSHEITVKDVARHSLGVTYWAGDCTTSQIKGNDQLAERLVREGAKSGDVRISLMWDDTSDLDVHVVTPSSQRIYYGGKRSNCGGELDVDMNAGGCALSTTPVENVYWGHGVAPRGEYSVTVAMYRNRNVLKAESSYSGEVEVGGVVTSFRGKVGEDRKVQVAQFRFDGSEKRKPSTTCERKMKLIIPKNSALPFAADPQVFVVSDSLLSRTHVCVLNGLALRC